jgi:hypothetical protein
MHNALAGCADIFCFLWRPGTNRIARFTAAIAPCTRRRGGAHYLPGNNKQSEIEPERASEHRCLPEDFVKQFHLFAKSRVCYRRPLNV